MKSTLVTLTIVLYSFVLVAQLPTQIPDNPADLELANSIIAAEFAPEIHQLVEKKYHNSADGRADLIVALDYNGWENVGSNWEDLPNVAMSQLLPKVYYSVVWTSHAWVVTYALYHARDYSKTDGGCCSGGGVFSDFGDNHEHDLEGVILVLDRSPNNLGEVIGGFTTWHEDLFRYPTISSVPTVFCDNQTHAIELNLSGDDDISSALNPCDDGTGVEMAGAVIYNHSAGAPTLSSLTVNPDQNDFLTGTGTYELEDIFGQSSTSLFNLRNDPTVFTGNLIYSEETGGCQDDGSPAKAPWGWEQMDYNDDLIAELICQSLLSEDDSDPDPNTIGQNNDQCIVPQLGITIETGELYFTEHNPYLTGKFLIVLEDMDFNEPDINKWERIIIGNGATLTIKDKTVRMMPNSNILIFDNSSLIVENSTIEGCSDLIENKWDGIKVVGDGASIKIFDNSLIRNTKTAVTNKSFESDFDGFDMNLQIINSTFTLNEFSTRIVGGTANLDILITDATFSETGAVHFLKADQGDIIVFDNVFVDNHDAIIFLESENEDIILSSNDFISNDVGIYFTNVSGASVVSNTFDGTGASSLGPVGINSFDSRVSVTNNNTFKSLWQGIFVSGTGPMQSGIEIGHEDALPNIFLDNWLGVDLSGSDFPTGANIINNTFDNTLSGTTIIGVYKQGANIGFVKNNTFLKNQSGVYASGTGPNLNFTQCNEFQSGLIQDLAYNADNSLTMFLENDFDSPDNLEANVQLYGVATIATQGEPTNAAGNCFTETLPNSIALEEDANSFDYFYYDQGDPCEEPTSESQVLPFGLVDIDVFFPRCEGIGSGINSPGGTGGDPTSQEPPTGDPTLYYCTSCIKDSIQHWVDVVIQTGGNDPTAAYEEPVTPIPTGTGSEGQTNSSSYSEIMLDQWVNYALFVAIDSDDYAFGEEVLSTLKSWKWSIKLYGLALLEKDYTKASNILGTFPQDDTEQIAFHTVQNINLKRLTQATVLDPYIPTELEKTDLFDIGTSDHICSGFARGLYKVLTDITIPPYIKTPSTKNSSTPRSGKELDQYFTVFPNPLKNVLNLGKLEYNKSYAYEIVDLVGKGLLSGEINESVNAKIDVASLKQGLYHIVLQPSQGEVQVIRFVKQ